MSRSTYGRLGGAVLVALFLMGVGAAGAGNPGDPFKIGVSNTVNASTLLSGSVASTSQLRVTNTNAATSVFGVYGIVSATAPVGASAGVRGDNKSTNSKGYGVYGLHAGAGIGVYGTSPQGYGVYGKHTGTTGSGAAVRGDTASTAAGAYGVYGLLTSTSPGTKSAAVRGESKSTDANTGYGVWGSQAGSGIGVYGTAGSPSTNGAGVYGVGGGLGAGVYGTVSGAGEGTYGVATTGIGAIGVHTAQTGVAPGVAGVSGSSDANATAVKGLIFRTDAGSGSAAVYGANGATSGTDRYGVYGQGPTGVYGQASLASGTGGLFTGFKGVDASSSGGGGTAVAGTATGSNGNGVVGTANNGSQAYGVEGVSTSGYAGFFDGNVKVVNGYMTLTTQNGAPSAADCDAGDEAGRVKVDLTNSRLWVCTGAGGWKYAALS